MPDYTFADLVGDEKRFFADYFNQQPMLRKRSIPGDPREILSIRKLDELVNLEVITPPYIKVNLNGGGVPEAGYTRSVVVQGVNITDTVVPWKVYELFRAGATITWCSLNHVVPELRDFTRIISTKMAVRTDLVAFLTPGGKKGYPPHHDPVDLFILQLEGTKHWKLWPPPANRMGDNEQYTVDELGSPSIEVSLAPGDVLYLPYGTPHAAAAEATASLHLSIMMRPRMWKDLLLETLGRLLQDAQFNEYPYLGDLSESPVPARYEERLRTLAARLASVDVTAELHRLAELGRNMEGSSSANTFQSIAALDEIGPDVLLRRTGASVDFGRSENGRTQLTVNGNKIAVPAPVADQLVVLQSGASIPAAELFPGAGPTRSTKAAQGLTRVGVLEVAGAR